jgi:hypothetical protein
VESNGEGIGVKARFPHISFSQMPTLIVEATAEKLQNRL